VVELDEPRTDAQLAAIGELHDASKHARSTELTAHTADEVKSARRAFRLQSAVWIVRRTFVTASISAGV
jgi:hypothetical protein